MAIITKTAAQWAALSGYILAIGDTGYESDTYKRKIGNGITPWKDLKYKDLFRPRRDTRAIWLSKNPILGEGEFVIESDTGKYKIGDGIHPYSEIEYGYKLLQSIGNDKEYSMSQKAITEAINTKIVDASELIPFDGFAPENIVLIQSVLSRIPDEVLFSNKHFHFVAYDASSDQYFLEWPDSLKYNEKAHNGNWFARSQKIFSWIWETYMVDYDNTELLVPTNKIVPIYQTTGNATDGPMSQAIVSKLINQLTLSNTANNQDIINLRESLVGNIVIDLDVIRDPDQELNITTAGIYRYITLGPIQQGKPQARYQNTLIITDNKQYLFSNNGILTRSYDGTWSEWRNVLNEITANNQDMISLRESLVGNIVIDLDVIRDPDQELNITTAGIYRYITLGPIQQGKPQARYQNTLIVTDNKQYLFSNNGILTRSYDGTWSEWRNVLNEITANNQDMISLRESLVGNIVIDLDVIRDPDQELNITIAGIYRYITLGPIQQGKPQARYQNTLIVTDNKQYLFSNNGILTRSYDGTWSEWRNVLNEITDLQNKVEELKVENAHLLTKSVNNWTGLSFTQDNGVKKAILNTDNNVPFTYEILVDVTNGINTMTGSSILFSKANLGMYIDERGVPSIIRYYGDNSKSIVIKGVSGFNHILFCCDENYDCWTYGNGVKGNVINIPEIATLIQHVTLQNSKAFNLIRKYNYAMSQDDANRAYNQGRCLDVVLGDGWRKPNNIFDPIFVKVENYEPMGTNGSVEIISGGVKLSSGTGTDNPQYPRLSYTVEGYNALDSYTIVEFDYNVLSGNPRLSLIETMGHSSNGWDNLDTVLQGKGRFMCRSKSIGTSNASMLRLDFGIKSEPYEIEVTNVKVTIMSILDEFTPSSLTPTKWINLGANKTDIDLVNPVFTSQPPITERMFGLSTDTKPVPVAMGQKYYTTDTGDIFEVCAKSNTEQFAVPHYKKINN